MLLLARVCEGLELWTHARGLDVDPRAAGATSNLVELNVPAEEGRCGRHHGVVRREVRMSGSGNVCVLLGGACEGARLRLGADGEEDGERARGEEDGNLLLDRICEKVSEGERR